MTSLLNPELVQTLQKYQKWLLAQPLSRHTQRAYSTCVAQFCSFLQVPTAKLYGDPFIEETARDFAVRDFKAYLLIEKKYSPASANLSLAALDQFFRFLGLGPARCSREEATQLAPHALAPSQQKHLLRVLKSQPRPVTAQLCCCFCTQAYELANVLRSIWKIFHWLPVFLNLKYALARVIFSLDYQAPVAYEQALQL